MFLFHSPQDMGHLRAPTKTAGTDAAVAVFITVRRHALLEHKISGGSSGTAMTATSLVTVATNPGTVKHSLLVTSGLSKSPNY